MCFFFFFSGEILSFGFFRGFWFLRSSGVFVCLRPHYSGPFWGIIFGWGFLSFRRFFFFAGFCFLRFFCFFFVLFVEEFD